MTLPPPPWVVAHRGASGERLENTVDACLLAVAQGAPALEVDVQLTADGELVVFHDWDLARLGAGAHPAGDHRVVERLTAAELRATPLALVPPAGGVPLRGVVPTLAELLAALPAGFPVDLELKRRQADRDTFAAAFANAVAARPNTLASSFDWELLAALRERAPALPLAPLESRRGDALLAVGEDLGAWSVHAHRRLATPRLIAAAAAAGRPLLVYTVNDVADARQLFALGVAGVFTDWPARLLRELAAAC
ncbi:MAG TPA: glycerophosphodiester phosphodiesterase [Thermoanaerobaculia bacterium]|jgi:glycerophosphoryl diester phosphodiesterase|nr:glycerophosphodiester phosphodiesterase [Thermoanaerobaculia bacterium]